MRLIKKKSKKTYKNKDGEERYYVNYFVELDNGRRVCVKPLDEKDYRMFDAVAVYER